jgi:hypothetical protein
VFGGTKLAGGCGISAAPGAVMEAHDGGMVERCDFKRHLCWSGDGFGTKDVRADVGLVVLDV